MSFSAYYAKGIAIGVPHIKSDCMVFHYRGEEIPVPSAIILRYPRMARYNGAYYEAKIKDVRKAAKTAREK